MMLNDRKYKQIVNEWFARLEKGYAQPPYTKHELKVLDEVMQKHNLKLNEAPADFMASPQIFEDYIVEHYVFQDQKVDGLDTLYALVVNKPEIVKIIDTKYSRNLQSTKYSMSSSEKQLFDIIMRNINIKNGNPSELWFSIIYNGKVKGGVAGRSIVSDVEVGNDDVSLKNYSSLSSVDFGSLSGKEWKKVYDIIQMSSLITGKEVNISMTRDSIEKQLEILSNPDIQAQIGEMIQLSKTSNIQALKMIAARFQNLLGSDNPADLNKLIDSFLGAVNDAIEVKLRAVNYWGIIVNNTVYLETTDNIYNALKSDVKSNKLSPAIIQFKGSKLYVNGTYIHREIVN